MSNITKKIVASVVGLAMVVMMAPGLAQGATVEELQVQIDALMAQLATLQSQLAALTGAPAVTGCTITSFDRNLKQGMTGDDVKCLQIILNSDAATQVAATGAGSPGSETTYFGPLTYAAVVKFQEKYAADVLTPLGLTAGTGFVGAKTLAKLNSLLAVAPPVACTTDADCAAGYTCTAGACVKIPVAAGLTVALAADTPVSATIIADTTGNLGGQALIPMLKINFSAGSEGAVKVTSLKLKRGGISADGDISNAYLYDGTTRLAEMTSISTNVISFSNSAGIFTVPAGQTKAITVMMDLARTTSSGKTVNLSVVASTDVGSDATAVNGTFPITGSTMGTAVVSDLGHLDVTAGTAPASVNPGTTNFEVWNFTLAALDQDVDISLIRLTMVGTVSTADLANIKLETGGTQIGSTIVSLATDNTVTFEMSPAYRILKGQSRVVSVKADVITGVNRSFKFTIQRVSDMVVKDVNYNVSIKPSDVGATDAFTVKEPSSSTSINVGSLSVAIATDSPSGNIAKDGTSVVLAKFNLKAIGEPVKITAVKVRAYGTVATNGLDNGKVLLDGSQIGATTDLNSSSTDGSSADTDFTSLNVTIPANQTSVLSIVTDVKKADSTSYTGGETVTAKLQSLTAQGTVSLSTITIAATTGRLLTIATGVITAAKNVTLAEFSSTVPTGVSNATNVRIASFVVTAGSAEGAYITQIKLTDAAAPNTSPSTLCLVTTPGVGSCYQNLIVKTGGTEVGSVVNNPTVTNGAANDFSFTPATGIFISKATQKVFDVYADIKSGVALTSATAVVKLKDLTYRTEVTNTQATLTSNLNGQVSYIAAAGTLTIAVDADTPLSLQYAMGTTDQVLAKFKITTDASEGVNVSRIVVSFDDNDGTANEFTTVGSMLASVQLLDGATVLASGALTTALTNDDSVDAIADFSLATPWLIAANSNKVLTVKANINTFPNIGSSNLLLKVSLEKDDTTTSELTAAITASGASSGSSISGEPAVDRDSNLANLMRTVLTIAYASDSPAGASSGATDQNVAKYVVSNTANVGNYDAVLELLGQSINSTIVLAATDRNVKIYKDGISAGNILATIEYDNNATSSCTPSASLACIDVGVNTAANSYGATNASTTDGLTAARFTDVTIAAGTSKTIIVTADTLDAATGKNFSASPISTGVATGVQWSDGSASVNVLIPLPITPKTLTY